MHTYPQGELYQKIQLSRPSLRVGVMLDGLDVPAWVEKILLDIKASGFAEVSLILLNANATELPLPASRFKRLITGQMKNALYSRYISFDNARHGHLVTALHSKNVCHLVDGLPLLQINSIRGRYVDRFVERDLEIIGSHNLDVILRFGFNILKGDILNSARYGVWSYHHGDNNEYRGGPALFWEMYERNPLSGTILQKLTEALDGGEVIYRSYSATEDKIWLSANRSRTYWKAAAYVMRCLRSLYLHGEKGLVVEPAQPYDKSIYRTPTNLQMLPFLARLAFAILASKLTRKREQWFIAYRPRVKAELAVPKVEGFIPLFPPKDRFYADPFPIQVSGRDFVFFEELKYSEDKGVISYIEFDEENKPSPPRLALSTDTHLSYPFLFEWNGEVFMIPETAQNRTVTLFRAVSFPAEWEVVGNLLENINAADATLIEHKGTWYMFVNVSECGGSTCDELFLFFADSPLGPWMPHALNPIKTDVRSSRPAGKIFKHEGRLIRPAQDCSKTYGYAIQFFEVVELTRDFFKEELVGRIDPVWLRGLKGTHTYNASATIEVIDGKTFR